MTVIAVTGLVKEAEIVGTSGVVAVAGGGNGELLAQKLDALHGDIRGVISIGLGGGLSPHLKVGDVVIADRIITGAESWDCHETWRVRLMSRVPGAVQGPIFGSDIIIHEAATKTGLFDATGALVVDMESQVAARFAASRNLPLAALRVISDDAGHVLPPAALVAMKTSSTGRSILPESLIRAPSVAKAAFICSTGSSASAMISAASFASLECAAS